MDVQEETSGQRSIKERDKCRALYLYAGPIIDSAGVGWLVILAGDTNDDDWTLWLREVSSPFNGNC